MPSLSCPSWAARMWAACSVTVISSTRLCRCRSLRQLSWSSVSMPLLRNTHRLRPSTISSSTNLSDWYVFRNRRLVLKMMRRRPRRAQRPPSSPRTRPAAASSRSASRRRRRARRARQRRFPPPTCGSPGSGRPCYAETESCTARGLRRASACPHGSGGTGMYGRAAPCQVARRPSRAQLVLQAAAVGCRQTRVRSSCPGVVPTAHIRNRN